MTHPHLEGLIPCPFCGGAASIVYDSGNEVWGQSWRVGCTACSVQFKEMGSSSWRVVKAEDEAAQAKAIARWNRRTALAALPGGGVDAQDAARYRWLRQFDIGINHQGYGDYEHHAYADENINFGRWSLDRVIDTAMHKPTPSPHEADRNG